MSSLTVDELKANSPIAAKVYRLLTASDEYYQLNKETGTGLLRKFIDYCNNQRLDPVNTIKHFSPDHLVDVIACEHLNGKEGDFGSNFMALIANAKLLPGYTPAIVTDKVGTLFNSGVKPVEAPQAQSGLKPGSGSAPAA